MFTFKIWVMIIERTADEVIIRLSSTINDENLQDLANYGRYLELTSKFKVSQQQVDDLVKEVKKGRWAKTESKLGS